MTLERVDRRLHPTILLRSTNPTTDPSARLPADLYLAPFELIPSLYCCPSLLSFPEIFYLATCLTSLA